MNQACSDLKASVSTLTTRPTPLLISRPTSSESKSNGKPQIWIHIGRTGKVIELVFMPISHRQRARCVPRSSRVRYSSPMLVGFRVTWIGTDPPQRRWSSGQPLAFIRTRANLWRLADCRLGSEKATYQAQWTFFKCFPMLRPPHREHFFLLLHQVYPLSPIDEVWIYAMCITIMVITLYMV